MNTLPILIKREYWEHRGGFLWAPLWTAAVVVLLTLSGIVIGEVLGGRAHFSIDQQLDQALHAVTPDDLRQVGAALDGSMLIFASIVQVVLAFVLFFYLLGALYDDRRDRSVLFWKSLPIGDTATVVSKVVAAALVAPLFAFVITIAMHLTLLLLFGLAVLMHGGNPFTLVWGTVSPWRVWWQLLVMIPFNALWALPAYGWLLLCSAFARSKPFLWAVVPPVLLGWILFLQSLGSLSASNHDFRLWYWHDIVGRILLGVVPGSWAWQSASGIDFDLTNGAVTLFHASDLARLLDSAGLWIGVAAGIVMLIAAVWLRGRRMETAS
jgi:ABC-2 type transport system permease protein